MTRKIVKTPGTLEDLALGVGTTDQTRNNLPFTLAKVDMPIAVKSEVSLKALDVTKFPSARVYNTSETKFTDYRYDDTDVTGILPDTGPGSWLEISTTLPRRNVLVVASAAAYTPSALVDEYITISDLAVFITFYSPVGTSVDTELKIQLQQDATGGRTVTFSSAYKTSYSDTGNSSLAFHVITFVFDGSFWIEQSKTGWYS